jgi:N-acetylglucosamine kinase-like BadF-type ATPase
MNERMAVGVDAGGTGVLAIASRDGREAARGRGGPANATSRGVDAAADAIAAAVNEATEGNGAFALFVGAAGAGREDIAQGLAQALRARLPRARAVRVEEDARIALRAGIPEGAGVVLIAGTGSAAYAENGEARVRVGGAGYLLGDEGSAFAIGTAALRALARVLDGRAPADDMTERVRKALCVNDRSQLLAEIYGETLVNVARVASLARDVLESAGAGDRAASKIVQSAARDLGDLACAAAKQAELTERSPSIVLSGGLLRENSLLTYVLQTRLQADIPGATIVRNGVEPALAALRSAERLCAESAR